MLTSTEYKLQLLIKTKNAEKTFVAFKLSNHVFNMVINVELPVSYCILSFIRIKSSCSVEHKKVL